VRVGVLGAWSIDNPGDALIGWATRRALRVRLPEAEVVAFAPRLPGGFWGHDFSASRGIDGEIVPVPMDDFGWTRDLDALIVGGGGIVIPEPGFDTFLLDERWNGPPAAWNAVCSQSTPAAVVDVDRRRRVRRACEQLAYVSVRNTTTATFLRQCGFEGPVAVVPDPAFEDPGVVPARALPGFAVSLSLGATVLNPDATTFYSALFDALDDLTRGARAATMYLVPFGTVYGDGRAQRAVIDRFPGCRILSVSGPLETWRSIGGMRLHIGARLHSVVAACTQGIPFLALDEYFTEDAGTSKIRDLMIEAGLEAYCVRPTVDGDPTAALERSLALADSDGRPFAGLVARMRVRLGAHWDDMLAALGLRTCPRAQGIASQTVLKERSMMPTPPDRTTR
jgi:polysaccharide pyruvyl transferase WcaK-like protein